MHPARNPWLALPLLLGTACASVQKSSLTALEPLRYVDSSLVIQPAARGLELPTFHYLLEDEATASPRFINVSARFFSMRPDQAEQLLGAQASGLISMVVPRARGEQLLGDLARERPGFTLENEMKLSLHEGQEGNISLVDQRAYVAGYTLRSSGQAALADPEIGVAQDGNLLLVTGFLDESDEQVTIDLRLDTCRFDHPFAEIEVAMSGGRVFIQEPRGMLRSLSTSVRLGGEEVLLIGGADLAGADPRGSLFVLVEARELPSEGPAGPTE